MLRERDIAPDFDTTDCHGNSVRLSRYRGRRVVLFFFPRAFTIACTIEVRAFQENLERLRELGADVIGISVDAVVRQCEFARQEKLTFPLIADPNRAISQAYGVLWPVLNVDRRATFVIDAAGVIERVIHHEVRVYRHLDDVVELLQGVNTSGQRVHVEAGAAAPAPSSGTSRS